MRALAGPALLLVVVGSFGLYKVMAKPSAPPNDFLDLEFAGADSQRTGSCYSLSTVLVATTAFLDVQRTWKLNEDDTWTLTLESLQYGQNGPAHVFQSFTFERHDDRVHLKSVSATKGVNTDVEDNIDALLEGPHDRRSTPIARCQGADASGYQFKRPGSRS
jgi:hypothetical protein